MTPEQQEQIKYLTEALDAAEKYITDARSLMPTDGSGINHLTATAIGYELRCAKKEIDSAMCQVGAGYR